MNLSAIILRNGFSRLVLEGCLEIILPSGQRLKFGEANREPVVVRLTDNRAVWALLFDPDLRTGELFTEERLVVERGSVYDFISLILDNSNQQKPTTVVWAIDRIRTAIQRFWQRNGPRRAQLNVAHHYDLGDELYELFLDSDWQYSCAYFEYPGQSLEDAQLAKKRHIAAKLLLNADHRVLDIGCGWGGLALYLTGTANAAEVLGVTLSHEQIDRATQRAEDAGLAARAKFEFTDYRSVVGIFDRIVSVGMFEHVGLNNYRQFFRFCAERLSDDGVMLLHTIGCSDAPSLTNPWIAKYIFPGGHLPSLSDIVTVVEEAGLIITDVEVLRLHYAETLRAWRDNFTMRREAAVKLFDEQFCRMWEYYLSMSEAAFRYEGVVVFQVQIAKQQKAVPQTRNYIQENELKLKSLEPKSTPSL